MSQPMGNNRLRDAASQIHAAAREARLAVRDLDGAAPDPSVMTGLKRELELLDSSLEPLRSSD